MAKDKVEISLTPLGAELIIREGQAAPIREPNIIAVSGDINSISTFLSKRHKGKEGFSHQAVDPTKVVVLVDRKAMTIKLQLDPESHFGASVTGKLELSDELSVFKINGGETFTRDQLIKVLRFNRRWFLDGDKHSQLLSAYQSFNAKAFIDMMADSDTRGNKAASYKKEVKTDLPEEFILSVPIFKGQPNEIFRVEICLDVTDGGARFWFESVELAELTQRRRDEIFAEQLKACEDFVVINQ